MSIAQGHPHPAPARPRATVHWAVRTNHRNRSVGFGIGAVSVGLYLHEHGHGALAWWALVFQFFVYPHLLYLRGCRAKDQFSAELQHMLADSVLFGIWAACLGFPLWIVAMLNICTAVNLTAFRGLPGTAWSAAAFLAGLGLGGLATAATGQLALTPDTSLPVSVAALVALTLYLLAFAHSTWMRAILLSETRTALRHTETELRAQLQENQALQERLRQQANRDSLTGLYNRHFLEDNFARELARCDRDGNTLSVLLIDLDRFKEINDTWGHPAGDGVLVQVARLLLDNARATDIVCRYGGEEFLLVLPNTPLAAAQHKAEELRRRFESTEVAFGAQHIPVRISVGVATYPDHAGNVAELLARGDSALYRAKHSGRNRVVSFEAPAA